MAIGGELLLGKGGGVCGHECGGKAEAQHVLVAGEHGVAAGADEGAGAEIIKRGKRAEGIIKDYCRSGRCVWRGRRHARA